MAVIDTRSLLSRSWTVSSAALLTRTLVRASSRAGCLAATDAARDWLAWSLEREGGWR